MDARATADKLLDLLVETDPGCYASGPLTDVYLDGVFDVVTVVRKLLTPAAILGDYSSEDLLEELLRRERDTERQA